MLNEGLVSKRKAVMAYMQQLQNHTLKLVQEPSHIFTGLTVSYCIGCQCKHSLGKRVLGASTK